MIFKMRCLKLPINAFTIIIFADVTTRRFSKNGGNNIMTCYNAPVRCDQSKLVTITQYILAEIALLPQKMLPYHQDSALL